MSQPDRQPPRRHPAAHHPELAGADPIAIMSAMLKPTLALLVLLAVPGALLAQETETEKQAAREVLDKMAALEQSLDVPALVVAADRTERRRAIRWWRAPRS